ncbi:hypothetical protein OG698_46425 [Streptomyces sp. NBC_01003]|uniref:hypothetical protein n=1 Tax=Streptomyces sp. NBC_01003 TaxID=2903714 RepID=UPI00386D073A|nr:hypothetical protein OG698_46425 [Streptomyces sp. NBC_01003]
MPFTVTGAFDDGATYAVPITGRTDRPAIGSYRAATLVELHQGEGISLSPTSPVHKVAGDDEVSVLAVLHEYTDVLEKGAEAPRHARVPGS